MDKLVLIREYLPGEALRYEDRGLTKDQLYTYKVLAVNRRGLVSEPIVAGN